MKTDEELPPYDFGGPRDDVDKEDMPWPTSGLPYHVTFLSSRKPRDKLVNAQMQVPTLSAEEALIQRVLDNSPPQSMPSSYVNGNDGSRLKMSVPEPGTEEFILLKRRQGETKKSRSPETAPILQAQGTSRQFSQQVKQPELHGCRPSHPMSANEQPSARRRSTQEPFVDRQHPPSSHSDPGDQNLQPSHREGDGRHASSHYPMPEYPRGGHCYFPGHGWYPYPPHPTAALKPIRRLAKIRPYANQTIPVSAEEICKAMPRDASAVFHIMDRRINFEAFQLEEANLDVRVPMYSLLRAWVQDDPYRQIPPPPKALHKIMAKQQQDHFGSPDGRALKRRRDEPLDDGMSEQMEKKNIATVDVTGYLLKAHSQVSQTPAVKLPSIFSLRVEMVKAAREKKLDESQGYKQKFAATQKGLWARGIVQG